MDDYGWKHAINHMVAEMMWPEVTQLLTSLPRLDLWRRHTTTNKILRELYYVYTALQASGNQKNCTHISQALFAYLLSFDEVSNEQFNIDDIYNILAIFEDPAFWEEFLNIGLAEIPQQGLDQAANLEITERFYSYSADLARRVGDLSRAEMLLNELVSTIIQDNKQDEIQLRKLSQYTYDLGYIDFLRGHFENAIEFMSQSVDYAQQANNQIGAWISRCLEYRIRWMTDVCPDKTYEILLKDANRFLTNATKDNYFAGRWADNTAALMLDLYYEQCNVVEADKQIKALISSPRFTTLEGNGEDVLLSHHKARYHILKEDWQLAIHYLDDFWQNMVVIYVGVGNEHQWAEICKAIYDYGTIYQGQGNMKHAKSKWEEGLQYPDEPGNHLWKQKIQQSLDAMILNEGIK